MAESGSDMDHPVISFDIETPNVRVTRSALGAKRLLQDIEARAAELKVQIAQSENATGCDMHSNAADDAARFHDANDESETVFHHMPQNYIRPPGVRNNTTGVPVHFKPEAYDGSTDWPEYMVYFEHLSEMQGWDQHTMAMVLGLSLKGSARSVLANLTLTQRKDYDALRGALTQHFCPPQQLHLYQAELKACHRRPNESLTELGREIAKLSRLAYPTADQATRETIGINAFVDAIPGPAIETKLNIRRGRPTTILEAVALAMEVDALFEAEAYRKPHGRNPVHMVADLQDQNMTELVQVVQNLDDELQSISEQVNYNTEA